MRAASTSVKITPQDEFYMVGYMNDIRKLPALGIHDDPYSVLLLLETEKEKLLFVSIDVCILSKEKIEPMKRQLAEKLEMPYENIVVNAIHSHSCANGFDNEGLASKDNPEYVKMVTESVVKAAGGLTEKLTDVNAEYLKTNVRGWYGNRNDKNRPFDDEAIIVRFKDKNGDTAAAFLNFNCHATVVGPQNRYLTTDIIGTVRRNLTEFIGITPYTFTGASADLGNRQFRKGQDFKELERVGRGISEEIMKGTFKPIFMDGLSLKTFDYHVCYDNSVYFDEYKNKLEQVMKLLSSPDVTPFEQKMGISEEIQLKNKLAVKKVDFHICCKIITLGEAVIITFPGELANKFGMQLKKKSKGKLTFVIGYADDYHGYFVPAEDFGKCYESFVTLLPKGGTEKMIDKLKESL